MAEGEEKDSRLQVKSRAEDRKNWSWPLQRAGQTERIGVVSEICQLEEQVMMMILNKMFNAGWKHKVKYHSD